ncbi:MAG: sulfatase-like hydrolase/transferase [Pirellulales bacterium]|nr:sulfatase-like hydrolase/transferase [Pirellulales bacterium]
MADDQGWGDVAYNGNEVLKTPTLDEMAATGLRLDRFYAAAPVCSPTRASVLTGRHPNRMGCFSWGYTLRPQELTMAEVLKTAGYATGHFGKWHLGPVGPGSPVSPGASGFNRWLSSPNFFEISPKLAQNGIPVATKGEGSEVIVEAALGFIRQAVERKQPFLAVIWFGSPHLPHEATDEDRAPYRDLPEKLQHYYGEITAMDRAMGRLRAQLRELKIADHTLLWYTSDNGATTPGSTGGLRGKKGTLWEGGVRVPCVLEWPARIRSARTSALPCGTVDIYPTVLEIAGAVASRQPPLDGVSLVPLMDGRMAERPKPMGFWDYPAPGRPVRSGELLDQLADRIRAAVATAPGEPALVETDEDPGVIRQTYSLEERPGHAAWIDGAYKLHRIPKGKDAKQFTYSLYDIERDPHEENDLADKEPERTARMRGALEAWQQSVVRSLNGEDYPRAEP